MSSYISNLPEFPEYDDYILTQDSKGKYLLLCFDNGSSVTVSDKGTIKSSGGYHYVLSRDGTEWNLSSMCGGFNHPFISDDTKPVFSTVDCYDTSGNLVYSGTYYSEPLSFVGGMSSSDISSSLLSNIWLVIPLVAVLVVALVGIRKALAFFRGLLRGA